MDTIKIDSKEVKIIAHRGLSGIERENTCPAFVAACNRSYFGVETDIHVNKEGKFVIMHDSTAERVSLGQCDINIEESDYSVVEGIVLPDLDGKTDRKDIRVPLLVEYIRICKKYDKICVLELKKYFEESDIERLIAEINEEEYLEKILFISTDLDNCINLRNRLPNHEIQWVVGGIQSPVESLIQPLVENRLGLDIYYHKLTKENVAALHSNGIKVNCWTCDTKEDAEKLIELGVDFITTNILE